AVFGNTKRFSLACQARYYNSLLQFQAAENVAGGVFNDYLARRLGAAGEFERYAGSIANLNAGGVGDRQRQSARLQQDHNMDSIIGALDAAQSGFGAPDAVAGFDERITGRLVMRNPHRVEGRAAIG